MYVAKFASFFIPSLLSTLRHLSNCIVEQKQSRYAYDCARHHGRGVGSRHTEGRLHGRMPPYARPQQWQRAGWHPRGSKYDFAQPPSFFFALRLRVIELEGWYPLKARAGKAEEVKGEVYLKVVYRTP